MGKKTKTNNSKVQYSPLNIRAFTTIQDFSAQVKKTFDKPNNIVAMCKLPAGRSKFKISL